MFALQQHSNILYENQSSTRVYFRLKLMAQPIGQGDVILTPAQSTKGEKLPHLTLAEGEVTGHKHRISQGIAELYQKDSILYLKILSETATCNRPLSGVVGFAALAGLGDILVGFWLSPSGRRKANDFAQPA